ncbi:hypothetical protein XENOCAPTIV_025261, partial [Xenoophorus captivus]
KIKKWIFVQSFSNKNVCCIVCDLCTFYQIQEQRLLIILSNCQYLERRTFLNLADHFEKHGLTGTEKINRVSEYGCCSGAGWEAF